MTGAATLMDQSEALKLKYFYFACSGNLEGLRMMFNCGIHVEATDYNDRSALHICVDGGYLDCVRYLISQGARIDRRDASGLTIYDTATHRGHQSILKVLSIMQGSHKKLQPMHAAFAVMESFPRPIAMAMLEGRTVGQMSKNCVSIFFSEIVGFKRMRSTINSAKVSTMLSKLFKRFDALAYRHGVQKLDIIGDSYIATTNFTEEQSSDHAARIAHFAVDAVRAAQEIWSNDSPSSSSSSLLSSSTNGVEVAPVQIQVGLHCGPVSGCVIGSQIIKYTLLGDTVNTASRMQSTGLPGCVQCSATIARLIAEQAHDVRLHPRSGGVDVKGKGLMQTFWLESLRHGLCRRASYPELSIHDKSTVCRPVPSHCHNPPFHHGRDMPASFAAANAAPLAAAAGTDDEAVFGAAVYAGSLQRILADSDGSECTIPLMQGPELGADGGIASAAVPGRMRPRSWMSASSQIFRL